MQHTENPKCCFVFRYFPHSPQTVLKYCIFVFLTFHFQEAKIILVKAQYRTHSQTTRKPYSQECFSGFVCAFLGIAVALLREVCALRESVGSTLFSRAEGFWKTYVVPCGAFLHNDILQEIGGQLNFDMLHRLTKLLDSARVLIEKRTGSSPVLTSPYGRSEFKGRVSGPLSLSP